MLSGAPAELSDLQSSCHPYCIDTTSLLAWLQELPAVGDAVAEAPSAGQAHVGPVPTAAQVRRLGFWLKVFPQSVQLGFQLKPFPHTVQAKGRSPLLPHWVHWNGRSPVWVRRCVTSVTFCRKHFPHSGQAYGRSPPGTRWGSCRPKLFPHTSQRWGLSPQWLSRCFSSWLCKLKLRLHSGHVQAVCPTCASCGAGRDSRGLRPFPRSGSGYGCHPAWLP
uniref:Uncharacterized protein n=1 Tax=Gopherus agassizii TaxID=38772 RepID=A0A452H2X8_9SAUR